MTNTSPDGGDRMSENVRGQLLEAMDALLAFRHGDTEHLTRDRAQVLYAALANMPIGWRPISTAPKDGTEVDLWCVDKREGYAPRRLTQRRYGRMSNWVGEEVVGWNIGNPYRDWHPTHWMPLPAPPEGAG